MGKQTFKLQNGFSMLEMLIVVSILAIIAGLANSDFTGLIQRQRLTSAGEMVLGDLRLARSEAIKQNASVSVAFTDGDWATWQYTTDQGGTTIKTVNSATIRDVEGVSLSQNFTSDTLTFNNVRGTASNGTVTLTIGSYTVEVVVSPLGRVRICGNVSSYSACP